MTLDEVKKMPPISDERLAEIMAFEDTDISDCPELTSNEMAQFRIKRPQPEIGRIAKEQIPVDADIVAWIKKIDDDYLSRINTVLRKAMA
jgi:uncharacterized protein (DUF4415 family)